MVEFREDQFYDCLSGTGLPLSNLVTETGLLLTPQILIRVDTQQAFVKALTVGLSNNKNRSFHKSIFLPKVSRNSHAVFTFLVKGKNTETNQPFQHQIVFIDLMSESPSARNSIHFSYENTIDLIAGHSRPYTQFSQLVNKLLSSDVVLLVGCFLPKTLATSKQQIRLLRCLQYASVRKHRRQVEDDAQIRLAALHGSLQSLKRSGSDTRNPYHSLLYFQSIIYSLKEGRIKLGQFQKLCRELVECKIRHTIRGCQLFNSCVYQICKHNKFHRMRDIYNPFTADLVFGNSEQLVFVTKKAKKAMQAYQALNSILTKFIQRVRDTGVGISVHEAIRDKADQACRMINSKLAAYMQGLLMKLSNVACYPTYLDLLKIQQENPLHVLCRNDLKQTVQHFQKLRYGLKYGQSQGNILFRVNQIIEKSHLEQENGGRQTQQQEQEKQMMGALRKKGKAMAKKRSNRISISNFLKQGLCFDDPPLSQEQTAAPAKQQQIHLMLSKTMQSLPRHSFDAKPGIPNKTMSALISKLARHQPNKDKMVLREFRLR